jgi:large subunit ribosomal protein L24
MKTNKYKTKLKQGDFVQVISGKDKGKRGKITRIYLKNNRATVEGANTMKRHLRPTQKNPQGGIISQEMPIHLSNLMLVDPKTDKPTRLGAIKAESKPGERIRYVRVTKDSGTVLEN